MKISLRIFHMSRKVVFIITGVLLLSGAAGATALYIGKDKLLGAPSSGLNGLDCTYVQSTEIHKKNRFWIRKYIKTEPSDGLTRVKTALRVAKAVFEKERPDLIQVVVLDTNGPDERSDMRGHAIGADVIFVAEPAKLASIGDLPQFSATYTDARAGASGEFFGDKMHMTEDDIHHLLTSLSETTDCAEPPPPPGSEPVAAEGEGKKGKTSKGEGEAKAGSEGEKAAAEGEKPAAEGDEASAEGEKSADGAAKPEESKGWIASIKAKIFGSSAPAAPEAARPAAEAAPSEEPQGEAAKGEQTTAADPFAPATLPELTPPTHKVPAEAPKPQAEAEQAPEAKPHG